MKDSKEENLKAHNIVDLQRQSRELLIEKALEISNLATSGKKNSIKVKNLKRKIARIETEISAKIFDQVMEQYGE